jgi:hypothetical protein
MGEKEKKRKIIERERDTTQTRHSTYRGTTQPHISQASPTSDMRWFQKNHHISECIMHPIQKGEMLTNAWNGGNGGDNGAKGREGGG